MLSILFCFVAWLNEDKMCWVCRIFLWAKKNQRAVSWPPLSFSLLRTENVKDKPRKKRESPVCFCSHQDEDSSPNERLRWQLLAEDSSLRRRAQALRVSCAHRWLCEWPIWWHRAEDDKGRLDSLTAWLLDSLMTVQIVSVYLVSSVCFYSLFSLLSRPVCATIVFKFKNPRSW